MRDKKEIAGMFDDDMVNPGHQDLVVNEDAQTPPPESNEMEQFGTMKMMLSFQRKNEVYEKNATAILEKQEQLISRMELVRNIDVSLNGSDQRLLSRLPDQVSDKVKDTLNEHLPKQVKESISEINEAKENACKEIHEISSHLDKGVWISNKTLYIAVTILLTSMCFGGWGVSQLGEQYKVVVYWIVVLILPVSLWVKWFVKEKLFPEGNFKYPWRR